jgi:sec-independent protein translocase protein TatC
VRALLRFEKRFSLDLLRAEMGAATTMSQGHQDPDDFFANTRMSFGDHLEDLRRHLWRAVIGFVLILVLVFVFDFIGLATGTHFGIGRPVMDLITRPVEEALQNYYDKRAKTVMEEAAKNDDSLPKNIKDPQPVQIDVDAQQIAEAMAQRLNLPQPAPVENEEDRWVSIKAKVRPYEVADTLGPALRAMGPRPSLMTLTAMEAMMVYFKVALVCGVVLGSPWIFWQIWSFVAAGLYPHEKKYVNGYGPFSLGLFVAGVLLCEFIVIPRAIEALLWFNQWLNIEPNFRLEDWLSFAIMLPLIFGISFQLPLVMLFLERVGITNIDQYRRYRNFAIFGIAILVVIILPTNDLVTFFLLLIPMCLLYELGIWLCKFTHKPSGFDLEQPDPQEMVEV